MKSKSLNTVVFAGLLVAMLIAAPGEADPGQNSETPARAGEKVGIEDEYVRSAGNEEGYVVLSSPMPMNRR